MQLITKWMWLISHFGPVNALVNWPVRSMKPALSVPNYMWKLLYKKFYQGVSAVHVLSAKPNFSSAMHQMKQKKNRSVLLSERIHYKEGVWIEFFNHSNTVPGPATSSLISNFWLHHCQQRFTTSLITPASIEQRSNLWCAPHQWQTPL